MRALVIATLLLGCTPSPQEVCEKWASFRKTDQESMQRCINKMEAHKANRPLAYKCEAKCVMNATDIQVAGACREACN